MLYTYIGVKDEFELLQKYKNSGSENKSGILFQDLNILIKLYKKEI
jgi:hypothetical protein